MNVFIYTYYVLIHTKNAKLVNYINMSYNHNILSEGEDRCSLFGFWSFAVQLLLAVLAILVLVGKIKFNK